MRGGDKIKLNTDRVLSSSIEALNVLDCIAHM